ncbi:NifB/NifX family molybdenum-iron cluster-binding protein [Haloimpatiens sp. FM7330]|uniref:NifB/NifX family molybdenum-iron cluster-binding protein n=1 Tax=Haloimpatiens sp. FM7330 TaxID=3298610 RepID=UPI00363B1EA4
MKILMSAQGKNKSDLLDTWFGRCPYFQIYDNESKKIKVLENEGVTASQGAGIAAAQQVVNEKVEVVISGSIGPNAFRILDGANIKMIKAEEEKIEQIIKDYEDGKLTQVQNPGKAHQGMNK